MNAERPRVCRKYGLESLNDARWDLTELCEQHKLQYVSSYTRSRRRGTWGHMRYARWYELDGFTEQKSERPRMLSECKRYIYLYICSINLSLYNCYVLSNKFILANQVAIEENNQILLFLATSPLRCLSELVTFLQPKPPLHPAGYFEHSVSRYSDVTGTMQLVK